MKKTLIAIVLISSPILLNSCATTGTNTASKLGVKPYTMKTCLVTGSKLGSMGDPVTKIYSGQEVKFCCAPCVKKFERNPAKYLADLK